MRPLKHHLMAVIAASSLPFSSLAVAGDEHASASASMFSKMDTDHDGYLSRQEMAAGHAAMMKKH